MPSMPTLKKRAIYAIRDLGTTIKSTTDIRKIATSAGRVVTAVARLAQR